MRSRRLPPVAALATLALAAAAPAAAQASEALYTRWTALTGFEFQSYSFDPGIAVSKASQWNIPVAVIAPLGTRVSVDLTTHVAGASVATSGGPTETLTGLTDTELRLLYTLARDRAVASVALNLPTGMHSVSTSEFTVAGAIGSNYLSFPVANFGTGFGLTAGAAYAVPAGAWNVGVSGSLRYAASYDPFSDQPGFSYKPGVEIRGRVGADRLVGASGRVLFGLTASTFSNDQFTGTGTVASGRYAPGLRFIGDAGYLRVIGRSTLRLMAWDYLRTTGDTNGTASPDTRENVFNVEARWTYPAGPRLELEPLLAFRQWDPANYRGGRLYAGGAALRYGLSDRLGADFEARYQSGWVSVQGRGSANLTGAYLRLFLRYDR